MAKFSGQSEGVGQGKEDVEFQDVVNRGGLCSVSISMHIVIW
jgi:hypothetical protein